VVDFEPLALLVEQSLPVGLCMNHPDRQLRGQPHLGAIAVLERLCHAHFAVTAMVGIRGVQAIHPGVDRLPQEAHGRFHVDPIRIAIEGRQMHATESEHGYGKIRDFEEGSISHQVPSFLLLHISVIAALQRSSARASSSGACPTRSRYHMVPKIMSMMMFRSFAPALFRRSNPAKAS
jgi:hypothetical protein